MANPKFTRKHYEAVAKATASALVAIGNTKQFSVEHCAQMTAHISVALCNMFAEDNPRFDQSLFEGAIMREFKTQIRSK